LIGYSVKLKVSNRMAASPPLILQTCHPRELQMNYPRLCEAMDGMSDAERLSRADLDAALDTLTKQFWLIRLGEAERAIYKVNLRRKSGSTLADGIWNDLNLKLKGKPEE
jgi:hypothetical protein